MVSKTKEKKIMNYPYYTQIKKVVVVVVVDFFLNFFTERSTQPTPNELKLR
jgi:hypothetical protein